MLTMEAMDVHPPASSVSVPPLHSFVPVQHRGNARAFRTRIALDFDEYLAGSFALLEPFAGANTTRFSRETLLKRLPSEWRELPDFGRIRLRMSANSPKNRANSSKSGSNSPKSGPNLLRIIEFRVVPFTINLAKWGDAEEVGVALAYRVVELARPVRDDLTSFAVVGLHALARRIERGGDRSDGAVLRDLEALAHPPRHGGSEFRIAAPGGGFWRGKAMRATKGEDALIVRTFVDA